MPLLHTLSEPVLYIIMAVLLCVGCLLGAFIVQRKAKTQLSEKLAQSQLFSEQQQTYLQQQVTKLENQLDDLQDEQRSAREKQLVEQNRIGQLAQQVEGQVEVIAQLEQQKNQWQQQYQQTNQQAAELRTQLESQSARFEQEQIASKEKLVLLESAEQRLQQQFENLANKIFEQKHEKFAQSSKAGLDSLLSPLKEQIEGFKRQVTDQYVKEGQERASLKTEIMGLKELNLQITQDAAALTKALKGDNKTQGNWGEVVLERILKESGLREGHEFDTQVALKNAEGKSYQPDVVVHLPNDKDVVIDSKVSLAAYERYFNQQEDDVARALHLKEHVNSLRNHIKELGKKDYQDLQGLRSLDYVLLFIPIESAFLLAADHAPDILKLAFDNNIMLVSPTNLLVALRTINNIWQYEYQNQNAQKIADHAAKLYDKFHGFVTDMEKVGKAIESTQKNYEGAMNKLSSGKGNLVRQVEQFRKLGVQTNKKLDNQLVDNAQLDDEELDDDEV
ncbi:DNA recombination protein RmuC [Paraglaciecola hydrolytica]|uniref:Recombinase RmuC n=1 Tax=Paraglaciecola hydrolytica TaxID=1799789 RepID=A0A148KMV8_9ALTE|nr:DNA recombination protein RmuC [Paraglaciecola hydrolytica]KXI27627.1 recombinase RmuC [Paraglaciecola hydrolytica]